MPVYVQNPSKVSPFFCSAKTPKMTDFRPKSARFPCENANLPHCAYFTHIRGGGGGAGSGFCGDQHPSPNVRKTWQLRAEQLARSDHITLCQKKCLFLRPNFSKEPTGNIARRRLLVNPYGPEIQTELCCCSRGNDLNSGKEVLRIPSSPLCSQFFCR